MHISTFCSYIPTDEDIEGLPQIKRNQLTLHNRLGGGAFGDVFKGTARGLDPTITNGAQEIKVAVKVW